MAPVNLGIDNKREGHNALSNKRLLQYWTIRNYTFKRITTAT